MISCSYFVVIVFNNIYAFHWLLFVLSSYCIFVQMHERVFPTFLQILIINWLMTNCIESVDYDERILK